MAGDIFNSTPAPSDARISYGDDPNQFGDLRLPTVSSLKDGSENAGYPIVVFIHGGFWRSRYDLSHASHAAAGLLEAGAATWSIEYRRLGNPGGGWPGTFNDVGAAVDYLRQIASGYNLDLERVVVVGHSAGGHLAAWVAARHRIPMGDPLYNDSPLQVKAAVPLAGVVDLRRGWELNLSDGVVEQFLGGTPQGLPHRYATSSPIELLPTGVPHVLIHGTADPNVPYEISERYVQTALQQGDNARLVTLQGTGHFEVIDPGSAEWPKVVEVVRELL